MQCPPTPASNAASCDTLLPQVLQHGSLQGKRYATLAVSNLACNDRAREFFKSSDCVRVLRGNLVHKCNSPPAPPSQCA